MEEEEVDDYNHITIHHEEGLPQHCGYTRNVVENLEGNGVDPIWRQVLLAVSPILKSEMDV